MIYFYKEHFETAQMLRDKECVIKKEGKGVFIRLFDTKEWYKNIFQATSQPKEKTKNGFKKYNIIFLINGLPFAIMELKTPKKII
ncbi:MAG: type I restriction endonuclease [Candidatus Phytoplasma sp. TWB_XP]